MTEMVPANIKLPAYLAGRAAASRVSPAVVAGLVGGDATPRISIKGARFRLVEGGNEHVLQSTEIAVVVVGANPGLSKVYFDKPWTPDTDPETPTCYSLDGIAPQVDSTEPQSLTCATCPHNVWGSKITPTGQKTKACADQKRLAVVSADDPNGTIYLLQVTPAALKGLHQYQRELELRGIPVEYSRTLVSFDTDASFPKLKFRFGGFVSEGDIAIIDARVGSDAALSATGEAFIRPVKEIVVPGDREPEPKAGPKVAQKVVQKAAPRMEPEPEPDPEPEPEPTKGAGKSAKAAATARIEDLRAKLDALLEEGFDDDD